MPEGASRPIGSANRATAFSTEVLNEAERICRRELALHPTDGQRLYLRGLLAARGGRHDFAIACLERAVSLGCDAREHLLAFADVFLSAGKPAEALSAYLRALTRDSSGAEVYRGIGRALVGVGRLSEAQALFTQALAIEPGHPATHIALGDTCQAHGLLAEALAHYTTATDLAPADDQGYLRQGRALLAAGQGDAALMFFRRAVEVQPTRAATHTGLAGTLFKLGRFDEAAEACLMALAASPGDVEACRQLVLNLECLGRKDELADAWYALAFALETDDRPAEAIDAYRQALSRKPDLLRALVRVGWACLKVARPAEARRWFERAVEVEPAHRWSHIGLGQACHLLGDLERGWHELGWYSRDDLMLRFEQPRWEGGDLAGRTIVLWADQGLGDAIQLLRFIPIVAALGARVVVECHHSLVPLVETVEGVYRAVGKDRPLPPFDLHAPLRELPRILRTRRDTIPSQVPYIAVSDTLRAKWRARLAGANAWPTVGLVWSGEPTRENARERFATLAAFAPLARVSRARYISLQLGAQADDVQAAPDGLQLERMIDDDCTMGDTAAIVSNLDLVITVDTMAAHLAGALARPVWILQPLAADWRWHQEGDRTPWYPTMRAFSQTRYGDWSGPLDALAGALDAHLCSIGRG